MGGRTFSHVATSLIVAVAALSCANAIGLDSIQRVACIDCAADASAGGSTREGGASSDTGARGRRDARADAPGNRRDAGSHPSDDAGGTKNGCAADAECPDPSAPRCDLNAGICVACLPDADNCPTGTRCTLVDTTYKCVGGCISASDCDSGLSCCSGACVATATDPSHCGGCGAVCSSANVTGRACVSGVCIGSCATGFADCDGDLQSNGCETATGTDPVNCGACGVKCSMSNMATITCGGGVCNGSCSSGFADCNKNLQTDGCEVCIACSDCSNCGGCGVTCATCNFGVGGTGTQTCSGATIVDCSSGGGPGH